MPDWLSWDFWAKDSQSLNHLALIIAGVIGIPLLAIRTFAAHRQARTAEQGHITDRFTAAVELLGSDKLPVRLGAIYALERIAKDSRQDYWTIMETLTAYVRDRAPWPTEKAANEAEPGHRPARDVQATLTVLGRREMRYPVRYVDLERTNLRGALLGTANLQLTNLFEANLDGAMLRKADLRWATLAGAQMRGAYFEGAYLRGAILEGAHLESASLEGAKGLTQEQLNSAEGDAATTLPAKLTRPAH